MERRCIVGKEKRRWNLSGVNEQSGFAQVAGIDEIEGTKRMNVGDCGEEIEDGDGCGDGCFVVRLLKLTLLGNWYWRLGQGIATAIL